MGRPHWQDWVTYFLGLWVLGSPWFLEHSMMIGSPGGGSRAMWNLWLVGLAVVALAIVAVEAFRAWEEWANRAARFLPRPVLFPFGQIDSPFGQFDSGHSPSLRARLELSCIA